VALVALSATLAAGSATAGALTTVGEDFTVGGGACGGGVNDPFMYVQTASPGNAYAAPFDGVLTSWGSTTDTWDSATLKVIRLGSGNSFTVLGQDGPRAEGTVSPIRIPVRQGDILGLLFPPQENCPGGANPGSSEYVIKGVSHDVGLGPGTFDQGPFPSFQISVSARIEHDADHDGYGDETQDLCPTDPTLHSVCDTFPPQTSITKGPKKKTKSKKATFAFSSSEPGSTFECSLDGAAFHACASPMTATVKELGRHNFLVRARDTHGNLDTTEASWSWKVVKKKHRKHR
jgi:hypothetical protein